MHVDGPRPIDPARDQLGRIRMTAIGQDTLGTRDTLDVGGKTYSYYDDRIR